MNSLYKRIITIGMICITAFLAWIYCMLEYRDEPSYIIGISIILIVSVYALLYAFVSLHTDRMNKLKNYIDITVAKALSDTETKDNLDNIERISKALYVQVRKLNDTDKGSDAASNQALIDSVNRAVKILVKYNHDNNETLLSALNSLSEELSKQAAADTDIKNADNSDAGDDSAATVIPFPNE